MSNSVHSVQAVNAATQGPANTQQPKPPSQSAIPQDKVTISSAAQQALAKVSSGDTDHDGDSH
jgi:hypothetical protein